MSEANTPIRAGVLGWPAGHSLSPSLHGYWLDLHGIDGTYDAIDVRPENFDEALADLRDRGFAGVNVTVPHKEAAARASTALDAFATRVGAVNTIVFGPQGAVEGSNSDGFGFTENLDTGAPDWRGAGTAMVLGAGGAARAIVAAILDAGIAVSLVNRTREKADALAADIGGAVAVGDWAERSEALAGAGLLVNTTTLGMTGKDPLDISLAALPANAVVTDVVYAPLETPLLVAARERGHAAVDGLGMLLHQARPGFERWFGVRPEVTAQLRAHVLAGIKG